MGLFDSLRKAIAGPPRVSGAGDEAGEVAAALHEEYTPPASGDDEIKEIDELSEAPAAPGGAAPFATAPFVSPSSDIGPARAAEAEERAESIEAEIESQEDPVDPDT
jgi:hypothetical protein